MPDTSVISSLVELTRQRDQLSIRAKLLGTLMEASDASWIVLCRITDADTVEVLDRIPSPSTGKSSKHYPRELFDQIEHFRDCARLRRPVWVTDLEPYHAMIFNMNDVQENSGSVAMHDFVVLFNPELEGRDERTASSILDLYENFLALVIENTQDALTGLLNRGAFDRDLEAAATTATLHNRRCDRDPGCAYLAMLDIDHFKRINDRFGHLYGDEVLLLFAKLFRETFRDTDKLYRYGGEEFALIIKQSSDDELLAVLERFRRVVTDFNFPQVGKITVSIGAVPIASNNMPSNIIDRADQALYYAKESGRNRVQMFEAKVLANSADTDGHEVELF